MPRACPFLKQETLGLHQPRQEPGRYFTGSGLVAPGPHFHENTEVPIIVPSIVVVASLYGVSVRVLLSISVLLKPCEVTVTTPFASVSTFATYLDVAEALSQPQLPATGAVPVPD